MAKGNDKEKYVGYFFIISLVILILALAAKFMGVGQ